MFDKAINAIYSAAAAPELWPQALDAIAACYHGAGTVLVLKRAGGHWVSIVSPALAAAAKDYDDWGWKLDVCMARVTEKLILEPRESYTDRHLVTPEEIRSHPFYTQFRAAHGLGPFLATQLFPDPGAVAFLTIQGRASRPAFTDDDLESIARMGRHAERSLMLTVRLLEAEVRSEGLADVLSRLTCGILLAPTRVTWRLR